MTYRKVRLRRAGNVDLVFQGVLLADETSREEGSQRWAEVRIWRTDSGKYVVQRIGRSTVAGEVDKITTRVVVDPDRLSEVLRSRSAGQEFMSNIARAALAAAAATDPDIIPPATENI